MPRRYYEDLAGGKSLLQGLVIAGYPPGTILKLFNIVVTKTCLGRFPVTGKDSLLVIYRPPMCATLSKLQEKL